MVSLRRFAFLLAALLLPALAGALRAEFDDYYEVEIDPVAYFLDGYSARFGYAFGSARFDAGVFGAEVPEALHGHRGWKQRADGFGVKLDYYPCSCGTTGFFAGPEAEYAQARYEWKESGQSVTRGELGVGGRVGYRFMFGETGVYVVPWLGLDYVTGGDRVSVGDRSFYRAPVRLFGAVHLGWRF